MGIFNAFKKFGKFIGEAAESFSKSSVFKVLYSGVCLATLPLGVAALACGGVAYAGAYVCKTLDATIIKHFRGSTIVNDADWTATLDWIGSFNKQYLWEGYLGYPFIKASNLYQKEADKWLEESGRGNSKDVGNDSLFNVLTRQSPAVQIANLKENIVKAGNDVKKRMPLEKVEIVQAPGKSQKTSDGVTVDITNSTSKKKSASEPDVFPPLTKENLEKLEPNTTLKSPINSSKMFSQIGKNIPSNSND